MSTPLRRLYSKPLRLIMLSEYIFIILSCIFELTQEGLAYKYFGLGGALLNAANGAVIVENQRYWIHFNVFAGFFGFVTMTLMWWLIFKRDLDHRGHYAITGIHFLNWAIFLMAWVFIVVNFVVASSCSSLDHGIRVTFCDIPRVLLVIDLIVFLHFCITLPWVAKHHYHYWKHGTEEHHHHGRRRSDEDQTTRNEHRRREVETKDVGV